MPGIEINQLTKTYRNGGRALDGIDLAVASGELLALVGPGGSGKTTLLRLIAGLDQPTAGTIRLAGRDMNGVPPHRRNVSLVFQNLALYAHLRVRENLTFGNAPTRSQLVAAGQAGSLPDDEVAKLLEIDHLLNRYPAELSGGEQQRVALGRAIVRRPAALLLDEPLSSVDGPLRRTLRQLIKDVQRRLGVPTIYVTHDPAEALWLGDRVAVLHAGKLVQVGLPAEVCRQPATRIVKELFTTDEANLKMQSLFEIQPWRKAKPPTPDPYPRPRGPFHESR